MLPERVPLSKCYRTCNYHCKISTLELLIKYGRIANWKINCPLICIKRQTFYPLGIRWINENLSPGNSPEKETKDLKTTHGRHFLQIQDQTIESFEFDWVLQWKGNNNLINEHKRKGIYDNKRYIAVGLIDFLTANYIFDFSESERFCNFERTLSTFE